MVSDCETAHVVARSDFTGHVLSKPEQRRCVSVPRFTHQSAQLDLETSTKKNMVSDCEATHVVARGDFIGHALSKPEQRRCVSVPRSVRLNIGRDKVLDEEISQLVKGYFADILVDWEAASKEDSGHSAPTAHLKSPNSWAPEYATQVEVPQGQQVMFAPPHDHPIEPIMDFYTQPFEKTELNYQAEAYEPKVIKFNSEPKGKLCPRWRKRSVQFYYQCKEVLLAMKEAMEQLSFVQGVEVVIEKSKATVDAYIRPEYFDQCKEAALFKAKQALLDSAEKTKNIYSIGYLSTPFTTTPDGFFALLGYMVCIQEACWDTFCYGYCRKGDACKLQHPPFLRTAYINIKFATGV